MANENDEPSDLAPESGLTTMVDLKLGLTTGDSSLTKFPTVLRDANELRFERMMRKEHLVFDVPTPFLGRREALETLYNRVRDAVNQKSLRTISVRGDTGMGKTRLVAELFSIIDPIARGIRVFSASATEGEGDEGFALLTQLIRSRFEISSRNSDEEARERLKTGVSEHESTDQSLQMLRMLGHLARVASGEAQEHQVDDSEAIAAFIDFLKQDALDSPSIMVIHRAQFLTPRMLEVFSTMLGELTDVPLLIMFLQNAATPPELVRASASHDEVHLQTLDAETVERLARAILHQVVDLPDELVNQIIALSAGNPGLVEDNIRILVQRGTIIRGEGQWSVRAHSLSSNSGLAPSRSEASKNRIEGLSQPLRELLEMASAFGSTFWLQGLVTLARTRSVTDEDWVVPWVTDQTGQRVAELVDEALKLELIVQHASPVIEGELEYGFINSEDCETIYAGLEPEQVGFYHRMVAQWLLRLDFGTMTSWHEVIASHFEFGLRPERAAERYFNAATAYLEQYDLARASHFFQRAFALVDLSRVDWVIRILRGLGDTYFVGGDFQNARHAYGAMLEASLIPPSRRVGGEAWLKLGRAHRGLGVYRKALACFEHAYKLYSACELDSGVADALHAIAKVKWLEGEPGAFKDALRYFRESLALRREAEEPEPFAETLTQIAHIMLHQGDAEGAESRYTEALEIRRKLGQRRGQIGPYAGLGGVAYAKGDVEGAVRAWEVGLSIAEEVGDKDRQGVLLSNLGEMSLQSDALERAETCLLRARDLSQETGDLRTRAEVSRNLAVLFFKKAAYEQAKKFAAEAVDTSRAINARPTLGLALRTQAELSGNQLYDDGASGSADSVVVPETAFEEALAIFEALEDSLELARTLRAYAGFLEERGSPARAEAHRARANTLDPRE